MPYIQRISCGRYLSLKITCILYPVCDFLQVVAGGLKEHQSMKNHFVFNGKRDVLRAILTRFAKSWEVIDGIVYLGNNIVKISWINGTTDEVDLTKYV